MDEKTTAGQELWSLIEAPQGYGFIADSVEEIVDDRKALEVARNSLYYISKTARVLQKFIDKWQQKLK